jgi:DNA-binding MarR family transcriptional regulator
MGTGSTTCIGPSHSAPPAPRAAADQARPGGGHDVPVSGPGLHPHEGEAWSALRAVLAGFSRSLSNHLQHTVRLSYFEYEILETLSASPRSVCRLGDLAAACHSSLSTLSRAVSRLESRNLVTRQLDPVNGRHVVCELTRAGSEVLGAGATGHIAQLRRLVFDALTDQQVGQLAEICTELGRTLAAESARDEGR